MRTYSAYILANSNNTIFKNSVMDDLLLYLSDANRKILIGYNTTPLTSSIISISSNETDFNNNVLFNKNIYVSSNICFSSDSLNFISSSSPNSVLTLGNNGIITCGNTLQTSNIIVGSNITFGTGTLNFISSSSSNAVLTLGDNGIVTCGNTLQTSNITVGSNITFGTGTLNFVSSSSSNAVLILGDNSVVTCSNIIINGGASSSIPFQIMNNFGGVSAKFAGAVIATEYNTISDRRAKNNVAQISNEKAIDIIKNLRVASYQYYDDQITRYGLIAQEVEEVFPECVKTINDFIPNIASYATVGTEGSLTFDEAKAFDEIVAPGDLIKLINGNSIVCVKILKICKNVIWIDKNMYLYLNESVFVIGKEVDDFKVIDYQYIIPLLIKTVQGML